MAVLLRKKQMIHHVSLAFVKENFLYDTLTSEINQQIHHLTLFSVDIKSANSLWATCSQCPWIKQNV